MNALPALREDLILDPKPTFIEGQLSYLLIDPIKNTYFRIGQKMLTILKSWDLREPSLIVDTIEKEGTQTISEDDIDQTLRFLLDNELIVS